MQIEEVDIHWQVRGNTQFLKFRKNNFLAYNMQYMLIIQKNSNSYVFKSIPSIEGGCGLEITFSEL